MCMEEFVEKLIEKGFFDLEMCFDAKKAVEFGYVDENNKIWIKAKC